jgi:uncharacterized membrane protein
MATTRDVVSAALLGGASGLRSFTALGVLAKRDDFGGGLPRTGILLAATCELIADKLPMTPARIKPGPFAVRVATGAIAGGRVAGPEGAAAGALASAGATAAGYLVRRGIDRRTRIPDPVVGAAEDVLALGLALLGARADRSR